MYVITTTGKVAEKVCMIDCIIVSGICSLGKPIFDNFVKTYNLYGTTWFRHVACCS